MRHPTIPADLTAEYGQPEQVFGPNRRMRWLLAAWGVLFGLAGVALFLAGTDRGWFSGGVAVAMAMGGSVILLGVRRLPTGWVFVCPRGVVRKRGDTWEGRGWSEAVRFEDATLGAIRQSRLVWTFGPEWGFIADSVAEYDRLVEALRAKVPERSPGTSS